MLRWRRVIVPGAGSCVAMRPAGTFGSRRPTFVDRESKAGFLQPSRGFRHRVIAQVRHRHLTDPQRHTHRGDSEKQVGRDEARGDGKEPAGAPQTGVEAHEKARGAGKVFRSPRNPPDLLFYTPQDGPVERFEAVLVGRCAQDAVFVEHGLEGLEVRRLFGAQIDRLEAVVAGKKAATTWSFSSGSLEHVA